MSAFDLQAYLKAERRVVETTLSARLGRAVAALEAAAAGPQSAGRARRVGVLPVLSAGVISGGKRIRPILCVTAYRAAAGVAGTDEISSAAYDLAVSIEFIHAYSLMHDDLPSMDDADLRRGKPTPHTRFGVTPTLRAGAALIPVAAWSAWEAGMTLGGRDLAQNVSERLLEAAGSRGMVAGQAVDLESEGRRLEEEQLTALHGLKTGALLRAALEIGGLAGGASKSVLDGLSTYGTHIGLAFQIADDVLDRTGTAASLGKNPSDEALEKSTYVSLLGVEGARQRGAIEVEKAKRALADSGLPSAALDALADYILERAR